MALETLGIAAVPANARCKLDRAAAAFGGLEGSAARRRSDRYNYEEQQRFRRNLDAVTGGRSASTDGVLTAGAAEQQSIYTAFGGGESSFLTQYRVL